MNDVSSYIPTHFYDQAVNYNIIITWTCDPIVIFIVFKCLFYKKKNINTNYGTERNVAPCRLGAGSALVCLYVC